MKKNKKIFYLISLTLVLLMFMPTVIGGGVTCSPGVLEIDVESFGKAISVVFNVGNLYSDDRNISVYLTTPYDFRPRYHVMPGQNKMIVFDRSKLLVGGNGAAKVTMILTVPAVPENRGRRWETWITIESERKPGEVVITKVFARVLIQTPGTLKIEATAPSSMLLIVGAVLAIGIILVIGYGYKSTKKNRRKKVKRTKYTKKPGNGRGSNAPNPVRRQSR